MRVLLAEDDYEKANRIGEYVTNTFPLHSLETARSVDSALRSLVAAQASSPFDLLLLDMTMPTFDVSTSEPGGGETENFAGKQLLTQMKLRRIGVPTIVVTMYDGIADVSLSVLSAELKRDFPAVYLGLVYYSQAQEGWKNALKTLMESVEQ